MSTQEQNTPPKTNKIMSGIGVILGRLGGNKETVEAVQSSLNKTITSAVIDESELKLYFDDNTGLSLFDDGQSCCESRYMRTDDELAHIIGGKLLNLELKEAPNVDDEYGDHEVQFLEVTTDKGCVVVSNHNEHNGYYGGFWVVARLLATQPDSSLNTPNQ